MSGKVLHEENSRTLLTVFAETTQVGKKCPQYLAAIIATFGAFIAGTCLSWTSPALPLLQTSMRISDEEGSWVGALITVGAFMGAIPAGSVANAIGRKRMLQLISIPIFLSWIGIALSYNVYTIYIARFMSGLSVGGMSVAIPMYVGELAEARVRGTLGTLFQLQITLGVLFCYVIGMIEDFALLSYICASLPVMYFFAFIFIPESPVYLCRKDRKQDARDALQWFRGAEYDVQDELNKISDCLHETEKNQATFVELIGTKATTKGLLIALGLMVFQQLSGVNAVIFYTADIFKFSKMSIEPGLCTIAVGVVQVIATYISTILIDRAGRRILLIISASVMALSLGTLVIFFFILSGVKGLSWVPLPCVILYIFVFSLGFGPIPWVMMGELLPENVKGIASSIAISLNWILAFTVTKTFANVIDLVGTGTTFGIYGFVCVLGTIFVVSCVPETKGKDVDEIQMELEGKNYGDRRFISEELGTKITFTLN